MTTDIFVPLINASNVSMQRVKNEITNLKDLSDPQQQILMQKYTKEMVTITEFTSSMIKLYRDLLRSIISKIAA
ncbi:EscF/YscF/HrpA family type III secretion system needle major subunit [Candidatus Regiella endosymbiont of Tuberolachnus salignus]|uniref:EscF/YscF/HrpA family type III secretion system needle major subunit n=1 Tax=Candidatus Regiella endosymbiont of Tuberolachnus salignus TaxID=3077956 RepID=UPI003BAE9E91